MTGYEVVIKVTEEELEAAQYGSVQQMEHLAYKVIDACKEKGYVPSH